jgi:hypothetical protein
MKNKRVALAILAALLLLPPAVYYGYYGLLRHEHFYWGLPTSYWQHAVRSWFTATRITPVPLPPPSYIEKLLAHFRHHRPAVLSGDKAALPVLLDLIWCRREMRAPTDGEQSRGPTIEWYMFGLRVAARPIDHSFRTTACREPSAPEPQPYPHSKPESETRIQAKSAFDFAFDPEGIQAGSPVKA